MDIGRGFGGGFRPRSGGDERIFNPQRDIAYLTPALMQLTTNSFYEDRAAHQELICILESRHPGLTRDEQLDKFAEMCVCIGKKFCQEFLRGERTFIESLEASGLYKDFPRGFIDLWFKHFGHTMMSAYYYGYRDVLIKGESDKMNYDEIFDTAEEMRRKLGSAE